MSERLSDLKVGALKTTKRRTRRKKPEPIKLKTPLYDEIEDMDWLRSVDGIAPFIHPSLIIDLLAMLYRFSITALVDGMFDSETAVDLNATSLPESTIRRNEILKEFNESGFDAALSQLDTTKEDAMTLGVEAMASLVAEANPDDPNSILFVGPNQEVHRATQRLERNLFLNEPDVVERENVICGVCKSKKINARSTQRRAADEPPDVDYTCTDCGKKWTRSAA